MKIRFSKYDIPIIAILVILVAVKYWPEKELESTPVVDEAEPADEVPALNEPITINGLPGGHPYVDLGIPSGVMWSVVNYGTPSATTRSDGNAFYQWAATDAVGTMVKTEDGDYDVSKCIASVSSENYKKHYQSYLDAEGLVALLPEHDVARMWGKGWKTPSMLDFKDLINACEWSKVTFRGQVGMAGKSKKNGNVIFFPNLGSKFISKEDGLKHFENMFYATSNARVERCPNIDVDRNFKMLVYPYFFCLDYSSDSVCVTEYCGRADALLAVPIRPILEGE